MEFIRRVYENAKVTIPKELREIHGIADGDYVKLAIVEVIKKDQVPVEGADDEADKEVVA